MDILFSAEQIAARVDALGKEIADHYSGPFVLAPVLTGGFMFGADLARAVTRHGGDPEIDFVQLASYGGEHFSSGVVELIKDFTHPVEGKNILLVDDVLDSGRSLFYAKDMLQSRNVADVKCCVAVDKKTGRAANISADFAAFEAGPEHFLVGYGMDDKGFKRGLDYVGSVKSQSS